MTLRYTPQGASEPNQFACGITDAPEHALLCVRLTGDDVATYLQGQLTADIAKLEVGECVPGALCTVQGRVSAVFDILRFNESFALIMPASLVEATLVQLKRYVMRSKVHFGEPPTFQKVFARNNTRSHLQPGQCSDRDDVISYVPDWIHPISDRWEFSTRAPEDTSVITMLTWQQAYVLWGLAKPNDQTTQTQLPQMLNLDALHAVSFNKGCYTGQEIIARTHFRGTVKRRLFRYILTVTPDSEINVAYGDKLKDADGKPVGTVVEWATDDHQQIGLLAVMSLSAVDKEINLDGHSVHNWPLPYEVENPVKEKT